MAVVRLAVIQTEGVFALAAVFAKAAAAVCFTGNAVANLELLRAFAQRNDLSGPLVSEDDRIFGRPAL